MDKYAAVVSSAHGLLPVPTTQTMIEFAGGFAAAVGGSLTTLGLVALVGLFHKALNIYRGAGLLSVLALMAAAAYFSYQLLADPTAASEPFLGLFLGLGLSAALLLARARHYTPSAMLPPPPPPTLGSMDTSPAPGRQDPFE